MQLTRAVFALAATAVAVSAAVVEERLISKPTTTAVAPSGYGLVPGCQCFDNFDCMLGTGGKPCKCKGLKCYTSTTAGPTTTRKSTKTTKTTATPLPSGVPSGYHAVAGRKCFDAFDCLLGDFRDTSQKCVRGQCYSNKA